MTGQLFGTGKVLSVPKWLIESELKMSILKKIYIFIFFKTFNEANKKRDANLVTNACFKTYFNSNTVK